MAALGWAYTLRQMISCPRVGANGLTSLLVKLQYCQQACAPIGHGMLVWLCPHAAATACKLVLINKVQDVCHASFSVECYVPFVYKFGTDYCDSLQLSNTNCSHR